MKAMKWLIEGLGTTGLLFALAACGGDKGLSDNDADGDGSSASDGSDDGTSGEDGDGSESGSDGASSDGADGSTLDPSKPVITSVPGDTVASSLTPEQVEEVCTEFEEAVQATSEAMQRLACSARGIFVAAALGESEAQAACEASYAECIAEPVDVSCGSEDLEDCEATIDEMNGCFSELLAIEAELGDTLSCDNAGSLDYRQLALANNPATCTTLQEKCPAVGSLGLE